LQKLKQLQVMLKYMQFSFQCLLKYLS